MTWNKDEVWPIQSDATREDSAAKTPSPDAEGRIRLRDPGIGIGRAGDPMFTLQATAPHIIARSPTPPSSQESEDSTLGLSEPDGAPSVSPRSNPTPAPSSPSDGPEFRTSETSPNSRIELYRNAQSDRVYKEDGIATTMDGTHRRPGYVLRSGPAASPAKTSASPASGPDSPERAAASPTPSSTLWSATDLPPSSSRMYRDSSPVMAAKTLGRSSVAWQNSGTGGPTGFSTLNTSECPNDDDGCSFAPSTLAQVLEPTAPQRFYLSARAATGILRRATRRGRQLPTALQQALAALSAPASSESTPTPNPSSSVRRLTPVECERLMGWPDGWTIAPWPPSTRSKAELTTTKPKPATLWPTASRRGSATPAAPKRGSATSEPPTSPSYEEGIQALAEMILEALE